MRGHSQRNLMTRIDHFLPAPWGGVILLVLIMSLILGLGVANYRFVRNNPGGNDFLVYYIGTRSMLLEGISPYSNEVAGRIQNAVYGRPAQVGEHELRFVYPLYSTLLFAPFSVIPDYSMARAVWMTCLELCLLIAAYLNLKLVEWNPSLGIKAAYFLFAVLWYHGARGVINGNTVILIALMITLFLLAVKKGRDRLAGVLLAFSTIKPHLVILLIVLAAFWSLTRRRGEIVVWFLSAMAVLVLGGMLIIPNWILQNLWEIMRFPSYNPTLTLGGLLGKWLPGLKAQIRWFVSLFLGSILLIEWWAVRGKKPDHFLWSAVLTLTVGQWIGIPTDPGNFIILFPGLVLVLATWEKRWKVSGGAIVILAMIVLFGGLWMIFLRTLQESYQPVQSPVMFLPLPAFMMIGLYWIRWWVVNPPPQVLD